MILTVEAVNYYSSEVNDDLIERMGDDMNAVDYRMWGPQGIGCLQNEVQAHNLMCTQLAFVVTLYKTRSKGAIQ